MTKKCRRAQRETQKGPEDSVLLQNDQKAPQWQKDSKGQRRPKIRQDSNDKKAKRPKRSKEAQNQSQNDPIDQKA